MKKPRRAKAALRALKKILAIRMFSFPIIDFVLVVRGPVQCDKLMAPCPCTNRVYLLSGHCKAGS